MTRNSLIVWPDELLSTVSKPVDHLSRFQIEPVTIEDIIKGLFQVMYANNGVGLSAIQIGIPLRLFVMDCSKDLSQGAANIQAKPMVCVNPVIDKFLGFRTEVKEGCLSFPGIFEEVPRYSELVFTCEDLSGEAKTYQVGGLEAQCVAHEIDHLNGITFADKWGRVKSDIVRRKIKKVLLSK